MKTVVVTGSSRGIGLELVKQLSRESHVIATCRSPATASGLKGLKNVDVVQMDVADEKSIAAAFAEIEKLAPGIDELWNNAGQLAYGEKNILECSYADVLDEFTVNALSVFGVTKAAVPLLEKGKGKLVVYVSSDCGTISNVPKPNKFVYTVGKAGGSVVGKFLWEELSKRGYTVAAIHPGWVQTDMGGSNARLTPTQSVEGVLKVIAGCKPSDPYEMHVWDGSKLPW